MSLAAVASRDTWSEPTPARTVIPRAVLDRIRDRAVQSYPEECCGLLLGAREGDAVAVLRELACPNAADRSQRTRRFTIDPAVVIEVVRSLRGSGESLLGFYHSHPDAEARPSATDLTFVGLWPETVWLIVPVAGGVVGRARAWWLPLREKEAAGPRELQVTESTAQAGEEADPTLHAGTEQKRTSA